MVAMALRYLRIGVSAWESFHSVGEHRVTNIRSCCKLRAAERHDRHRADVVRISPSFRRSAAPEVGRTFGFNMTKSKSR